MNTLPIPASRTPSAYERRAFREIQRWRTPVRPWYRRAADRVGDAMSRATDQLRKVPGVEWTIENVVSGLLRLTNEITQDTVWHDAIYKAYRTAGHAEIRTRGDIRALDLEEVDRVLEGLDRKYVSLAAAEGAATGYAGASGIATDIVALVAINLRAAGEYATYCGFDLTAERERLYALQILDAVSGSADVAQQVTLAPVMRLSSRIARDHALQAVEQFAVTRAIQNVAKSIGLHLTRAKLAQVMPVTGAVVAGSFNAYYTRRVCRAAFHLYRERFLLQKYGPDALRSA